MELFVISEGRLFCDMITACLAQGDIHVTEKFSDVSEMPANSGDCVVILHSPHPLREIEQELRSLLDRVPRARVVLMPPAELCAPLLGMPLPVAAIIPTDQPAETLIGTVLVVQTRPCAEAPPITPAPVSDLPTLNPPPPPVVVTGLRGRLSNRERTILQRLTKGLSNKDIARDLGIRETTVKVHLRTCFRKLGVLNRTQAALWATLNLRD